MGQIGSVSSDLITIINAALPNATQLALNDLPPFANRYAKDTVRAPNGTSAIPYSTGNLTANISDSIEVEFASLNKISARDYNVCN